MFQGRALVVALALLLAVQALLLACMAPAGAPAAPAKPAAPAQRAAVAPPAPTGGAASSPAPARISYSQITMTALSWPFIIAGPAGFYARQGLEVDTSVAGTTATTAQALVAGAADVAQLNVVQHIAAVQKGADLALVAGNAAVPIYSLSAAPEVASYADLRGKSLAVAGVSDPLNYVLKQMLAANGLGPSDYDLVPVGGTPDRLAAVQKGAVAATLLTQPDDFRAEGLGLRRLGLSTDYVDALQYTASSVRRDWARQNHDVLVRFLRAYVEASRWFYDPANRAEAVRILVEESRADPAFAERTYDLYVTTRKTLAPDGGVNLDGLRVLAENWQEFGLSEPPPPTSAWLDLSYLEEAQRR
jgi:ABC-type nitrate/sulfonate/bicarbonate transport system substrate-binding protein